MFRACIGSSKSLCDPGFISKAEMLGLQMLMQLTAAEHRCVLVETEVREEVSNEMADLLRSMEASYKVQPCLLIHAYTKPLLCILSASYPLVVSGLVLRLKVRMQPLRLGNVETFQCISSVYR